MEGSAVDELVRLESERCTAISIGDLDALDQLLADELTHTHITGKTEDRQAYLEGLRGRPRESSRGDDLRVRLFGDVAVMTGTLCNTFPAVDPEAEPRQVELHALQVWVKSTCGWQQVAFASSGRPSGS
jgi:hypothetical protein